MRWVLGILAALQAGLTAAQSTTEPPASPALTAAQVNRDALDTLSSGDQHGAKIILGQAVLTFPQDARLAFFDAAIVRSQFDLPLSARLFRRVILLDPDGMWGKASGLINDLDGDSNTKDQQLKALDDLSQSNPNEPVLLWMVCVECRQLKNNVLGAQRFETLLKQWNPGPALVHHTYANILDELHRYQDSLPHRRLAVQLDPKSYSYLGLGNTLSNLGNWNEADQAYQHSAEHNSLSPLLWQNWAWSMKTRGDKRGQSEKTLLWQWARQANYDIRERGIRLANAGSSRPHDHEADKLYNSACGNWLQNRVAQAASELRAGMDRFPNDARFPLFVGLDFLASRQSAAAKQMFRLAIDAEPAGVYGQIADYAATMDNPFERQLDFQMIQALAGKRADDPLLLWATATAAMRAHADDSALIAWVELTYKMNPGPPLVHTQIADLLERWNQYDLALQQRQLAVKLDPSADDYQRLAMTLGSLQKWSDVDDAFQKSTSLDPSNPARWEAWATSEQTRGDPAQAQSLRDKAAALRTPTTRPTTRPATRP